MEYDKLEFKIPKQGEDYDECSTFVTNAIKSIMKDALDAWPEQNHNKHKFKVGSSNGEHK